MQGGNSIVISALLIASGNGKLINLSSLRHKRKHHGSWNGGSPRVEWIEARMDPGTQMVRQGSFSLRLFSTALVGSPPLPTPLDFWPPEHWGQQTNVCCFKLPKCVVICYGSHRKLIYLRFQCVGLKGISAYLPLTPHHPSLGPTCESEGWVCPARPQLSRPQATLCSGERAVEMPRGGARGDTGVSSREHLWFPTNSGLRSLSLCTIHMTFLDLHG